MENEFAGLALLVVAGAMSGCFALPMKLMRGWAWENTWLVFSGTCSCSLTPIQRIVLCSISGSSDICGRGASPRAHRSLRICVGCGSGIVWARHRHDRRNPYVFDRVGTVCGGGEHRAISPDCCSTWIRAHRSVVYGRPRTRNIRRLSLRMRRQRQRSIEVREREHPCEIPFPTRADLCACEWLECRSHEHWICFGRAYQFPCEGSWRQSRFEQHCRVATSLVGRCNPEPHLLRNSASPEHEL